MSSEWHLGLGCLLDGFLFRCNTFNAVEDEGALHSSPLSKYYGCQNFYIFAVVDAAGVAAANNFLALFNPSTSTKVVYLFLAKVSAYSVALAVTKNSIRTTRITASSVGTLQAASAIGKFDTRSPNPTAEVRTGNPTVTAAAEVFAVPPQDVITAAGANTPKTDELSPVQITETPIRLAAGEGVVMRQTIAGDVDQTFDMIVIWAEV